MQLQNHPSVTGDTSVCVLKTKDWPVVTNPNPTGQRTFQIYSQLSKIIE